MLNFALYSFSVFPNPHPLPLTPSNDVRVSHVTLAVGSLNPNSQLIRGEATTNHTRTSLAMHRHLKLNGRLIKN